MSNEELLARIATLENELATANRILGSIEDLADRAERKQYDIDPEELQDILNGAHTIY